MHCMLHRDLMIGIKNQKGGVNAPTVFFGGSVALR